MSAGSVAAEETRRLLEAPVGAVAQRTVPRRRPGVPVKQRGRTGKTASADDFNAKHKRTAKGRVGGGEFAKESASEHESEQLQKRLKQQGLYKGAIDGVAGPQTLAALKAFQRQQGIESSGQLDERTRLALRAPAPVSRQEVVKQEHELLADKKGGKSRSGTSSRSRSAAAASTGVDPADPQSVRKFQREHGLTEDGVIGPQTQAALRSAERPTGSRSRSSSSRTGGLPGGVLREGVGMDRKRGNGDVKQLQTMLQDLGYDLGDAGVDGKFGPQTAKALKAFQGENGLQADAVFGRHTRRLLDLLGARAHTPRGKADAPLSADEESLSTQRPRRRSSATVSEAGVAAAEALLLVMEAPDHQPPTNEERQELWRRFPFVRPRDGASIGGVTLKRDKGGLFVHTHRARSKSFPSVAAIPERVVRFIESTG